MAILTLGPEGTFSHQAASQSFPERKIVFADSIDEIFFRLTDPRITSAVIPVEIGEDFIEETIANLMKYDFAIIGKRVLKIAYNLLGKEGEITHLFADQRAFDQCRSSLRETCPQVKWIKTPNIGNSALRFKAQPNHTLALVSPFAQSYHHLPIFKEEMIGDPESYATFFILGKESHKKGEKNATSFLLFSDPMITIKRQIASLAHEKKIKILKLKNLLLQEGHTPLYFIEIEGHLEELSVHELFVQLSEKFLIKHLGSYPL